MNSFLSGQKKTNFKKQFWMAYVTFKEFNYFLALRYRQRFMINFHLIEGAQLLLMFHKTFYCVLYELIKHCVL